MKSPASRKSNRQPAEDEIASWSKTTPNERSKIQQKNKSLNLRLVLPETCMVLHVEKKKNFNRVLEYKRKMDKKGC